MTRLAVIIPVLDEALHLERCLRSLEPLQAEVWVVDSGSTDGTREIARAHQGAGVRLVEHPYEGPADQKNWALDELPLRAPWVLFLDADEWLTADGCEEILARIGDEDSETVAWRINRKIVWHGRWMRWGGWYPNWNVRLVRRGAGRYEQRRVHEHLLVDGPVGELSEPMIHEDLRDLSFFISKHDRYSTAEAHEYARVSREGQDGYGRLLSRDPLARRRWVKTRIWARLPLKPLWYFIYAWVLRGGFLDGAVGLRFHLMHAIFKGFDELKLWELERQAPTDDPDVVSGENEPLQASTVRASTRAEPGALEERGEKVRGETSS